MKPLIVYMPSRLVQTSFDVQKKSILHAIGLGHGRCELEIPVLDLKLPVVKFSILVLHISRSEM